MAMNDEAAKILVVDDSVQVCKTLSDVLGASGYVVRAAPSAERALQILDASADFSLIITDLKMTGMTGMELAKTIFSQWPGIPVVIMSGFGDMDNVIEAMRSGVADYIKKPFALDEVLDVVSREIGKSQARRLALLLHTESGERPPRVYLFGQPDLEQIDAVLSRLRAQTTAESAMLVEQAGYVIAAKGMVSSADLEPLSNLIVGTRSTSATLASLLGESQDFTMSYMEGQRVSVYTTSLGRGLYLVVIVSKGTKQGLVWLYAKESAAEIDRIVQRATESMQRQLGHPVGAAETEVLRQELAAQKVDNVFEEKPGSNLPAKPAIKPMPGTVSTISFKKPAATSGAKPDSPSSEEPAGSAPLAESGEGDPSTLSFDEAVRMGLLNFDSPPPSPDEKPAEPDKADEDAKSSTISFEEALRRGLLNFDSDKE